jgi:hypothetical protein
MEDHDVADPGRCPETVARAVDDHPVADLQRRLHRGARDAVGLDGVRLDRERQRERDRDDEDQLEQRAAAELGQTFQDGDHRAAA